MEQRLGQYLEKNAPLIPGLSQLLEKGTGIEWKCKKISFGQSNPTFFVTAVATGHDHELSLVLRKQPSATQISRGQHRMDREFRVLRALKRLGPDGAVPVPDVFIYSNEAQLLDGTFYVMERCRGHVFTDPCMPELGSDNELRRAHLMAAVRTMAKLHQVDWAGRGQLGDYGAVCGNYVRRQVSTMLMVSKRQAEVVDALPGLEELGQQFLDLAPADLVCLTHNDFKVDNLMFKQDRSATVAAVLDWELSTIGHPLADLAVLMLPYHTDYIAPDSLSHGFMQGFRGLDFVSRGIPEEQELLSLYASLTGFASFPNHHWMYWIALVRWRYCVIFQGVLARVKLNINSDRSLQREPATANGTANGIHLSTITKMLNDIASNLRSVRAHVRPLAALKVLVGSRFPLSVDDDFGHKRAARESTSFLFCTDHTRRLPHAPSNSVTRGCVQIENDYVRGVGLLNLQVWVRSEHPSGDRRLPFYAIFPLNVFGPVNAVHFESSLVSARVLWAGRVVHLQVKGLGSVGINLTFEAAGPFVALPQQFTPVCPSGSGLNGGGAHQACKVSGCVSVGRHESPFHGFGHRFRNWIIPSKQGSRTKSLVLNRPVVCLVGKLGGDQLVLFSDGPLFSGDTVHRHSMLSRSLTDFEVDLAVHRQGPSSLVLTDRDGAAATEAEIHQTQDDQIVIFHSKKRFENVHCFHLSNPLTAAL